ncbi:hypothetical protein CP533_6421 [Ophiocordyceps camponoti-saundersi (nom. inval.)]|nr:hypothetical protein CP533_6421 [Ophiocordyceps camponoti-saundersi (nom. inval.)]
MTSRTTISRTPSPSGRVHTPPAPRHGFADDWEPYSPRKSVRISSQLAATRKAAAAATPRTTSTRPHQPVSPRISRRHSTTSTMVSPVPSPRKKPAPAPDAHRQPSGTLTAKAAAEAAATLGLADAKTASTTSISRASGMLPTPSKTPQKPPSKKTAAHIEAFACNLFGSDDKRRPKKYSGMTLDSFTALDEDDENLIEIYTDLQDRVPVKDHSADNPFFGDAAVTEPVKRRSKRRLVHVPGQGALSIEEASSRDDGMVYVFRGKKFYRSFSEIDDSQPETSTESESSRPLTRSSIQPRLLFPRQVPEAAKNDDDEAPTDVEDTPVTGDLDGPQTPKQADDDVVQTPEAPKFAPVSPPDTKRTTRSANKLAHEGTPLKRKSGPKSPFDSWLRTKEVRHSSATKRHGESLTAPSTKRTRA